MRSWYFKAVYVLFGWAVVAVIPALAADRPKRSPDKVDNELRLFDGQPTRLYFTGNPHHPAFGREKLASLLDRYFEGQSPFVVDGLADARKDPVTQKPIRAAKFPT